MSDEIIQKLFLDLRRQGFSLGVDELLAALQAHQGGFGNDGDDSLIKMLFLLWCKSDSDCRRLEIAWYDLHRGQAQSHGDRSLTKEKQSSKVEDEVDSRQFSQSIEKSKEKNRTFSNIGVRPTTLPYRPIINENRAEMSNYYPITRRQMGYAWRYLRRIVADGPLAEIDVDMTIEQTVRQGFFFTPIIRRRTRNRAHLIMLLDHLGSMTPLHHYLRDLVETARYDSTLEKVDIYYFNNVPGEALYPDPLLKGEQAWTSDVLASVNERTSVLIVSDAGAARRHNDLDRIIETEIFLAKLKLVTSQAAWLNPMPEVRWIGTSAERVASFIPMFSMTKEGLNAAIDVLRGIQ